MNPDAYREHVRRVVDQRPDYTEADLIELAALLPRMASGPRPPAQSTIAPPDTDEWEVAA